MLPVSSLQAFIRPSGGTGRWASAESAWRSAAYGSRPQTHHRSFVVASEDGARAGDASVHTRPCTVRSLCDPGDVPGDAQSASLKAAYPSRPSQND